MKKVFFKRIQKRARGFTLIETVFYLTFLVVLLGIVVMFVVSISKTYQTVQATKNLESSAIFSLERITSEIRNAKSVNLAQQNELVLNTVDASQNPQVVRFYLDTNTGAIDVDSNGSFVGPLTLAGVTVNKLGFQLSTSANSQAVKVDLGLTSAVGSASTTKNFYTTVVLRGSY